MLGSRGKRRGEWGLLTLSTPVGRAGFEQREQRIRVEETEIQAGLPLPQLPIPSPWAQGSDINCDAADEMQPHGSLIRKPVISLSQRPGSSRESPSHLPSSPSHPTDEIRLGGAGPWE